VELMHLKGKVVIGFFLLLCKIDHQSVHAVSSWLSRCSIFVFVFVLPVRGATWS
jgi:hypothetical protein